MNKWLSILIGLILVLAPIILALSYDSWGSATIEVIKGGIVIFVILIGLLFLLLGISELKS